MLLKSKELVERPPAVGPVGWNKFFAHEWRVFGGHGMTFVIEQLFGKRFLRSRPFRYLDLLYANPGPWYRANSDHSRKPTRSADQGQSWRMTSNASPRRDLAGRQKEPRVSAENARSRRAPDREQVLSAVVAVREEIVRELADLPTHPVGQVLHSTAGVSRRRLYVRLIPEVCARLALWIRDVDDGLFEDLVHSLTADDILWEYPLGEVSRDLQALLSQYRQYIRTYDDWVAEDLIDDLDPGGAVQPWRRREDGMIAGDFVALRPVYVEDALGDEYAMLGTDTSSAWSIMDAFFDTDFLGLRVLVFDGFVLDEGWLEGV